MALDAIVLKTAPLSGNDLSVTLFTEQIGLIKTVARYAQARGSALFGYFSPFHQVRILLKGKGDWAKIDTADLLHAHAALRASLPLLEAGCAMVRALLKSQLPGKPAPLLFKLFKEYLLLLPQAKNPDTLVLSFLLKLERHEGILAIEICGECQKTIQKAHLFQRQILCSEHQRPESIPLSTEEFASLQFLALSRSAEQLCAFIPPQTLKEKVTLALSHSS